MHLRRSRCQMVQIAECSNCFGRSLREQAAIEQATPAQRRSGRGGGRNSAARAAISSPAQPYPIKAAILFLLQIVHNIIWPKQFYKMFHLI